MAVGEDPVANKQFANCSSQHHPSFHQVAEGSRNSRQQLSFHASVVSYVARNVCEGAWREDTTN